MLIKNDPKLIRAWCMYDWANSTYNLTITSSVFPAYYQAVTRSEQHGDVVDFFGWLLPNSVLYTYSLSFAFLCVVLTSPMLGGIADYFGKKKFFMQLFSSIGSLACVGLFFFTGANVEWGISMLVLASIGYAGSLVFYNAYLPEIVSPDKTDQVSAKGFSYGYIGSVVLLLFNLSMILQPHWYGLCDSCTMPARISFLSVGVWWFCFAQYSFWFLPESAAQKTHDKREILKSGFGELKKVWAKLQDMESLKFLLLAIFLYSMGAQTVMYVATLFGEKEFKLETSQLIAVVLALQLIAIVGAYLSAWVSRRWGNITGLSVVVSIWILICVFAYLMQTAVHFYLVAIVVGLVMGAIQSLSRSTFAKKVPHNTVDFASFFSFYEVTEKLAIVLGTFTYGIIQHLTGSMRNSIMALGLFFAFGLVFLYLTSRSTKKEHEKAIAD